MGCEWAALCPKSSALRHTSLLLSDTCFSASIGPASGPRRGAFGVDGPSHASAHCLLRCLAALRGKISDEGKTDNEKVLSGQLEKLLAQRRGCNTAQHTTTAPADMRKTNLNRRRAGDRGCHVRLKDHRDHSARNKASWMASTTWDPLAIPARFWVFKMTVITTWTGSFEVETLPNLTLYWPTSRERAGANRADSLGMPIHEVS